MATQNLLVDFPWFCISNSRVDVFRQCHFTVLTTLLFVAIVQHNLSVYQ